MYGKVMSITDDVMWLWYRELTSITPTELETLKNAVFLNKFILKMRKPFSTCNSGYIQ